MVAIVAECAGLAVCMVSLFLFLVLYLLLVGGAPPMSHQTFVASVVLGVSLFCVLGMVRNVLLVCVSVCVCVCVCVCLLYLFAVTGLGVVSLIGALISRNTISSLA